MIVRDTINGRQFNFSLGLPSWLNRKFTTSCPNFSAISVKSIQFAEMGFITASELQCSACYDNDNNNNNNNDMVPWARTTTTTPTTYFHLHSHLDCDTHLSQRLVLSFTFTITLTRQHPYLYYIIDAIH